MVGGRDRSGSSSPDSSPAPFNELVLLKVYFCEALNADYQWLVTGLDSVSFLN